jgi:hypothetical protein
MLLRTGLPTYGGGGSRVQVQVQGEGVRVQVQGDSDAEARRFRESLTWQREEAIMDNEMYISRSEEEASV